MNRSIRAALTAVLGLIPTGRGVLERGFATRAGPVDTAFRFADAEGYAAFSWVDAGLGFALVARMERPALLAIAEAAYGQLATSSTSLTQNQSQEH